MKAVFYAHQGTNRDRLIDRLIDSPEWSHVGQLEADARINHVKVSVYFTKPTKRARKSCLTAQVLSGWTLDSIS